jgi:hypothetical protein
VNSTAQGSGVLRVIFLPRTVGAYAVSISHHKHTLLATSVHINQAAPKPGEASSSFCLLHSPFPADIFSIQFNLI